MALLNDADSFMQGNVHPHRLPLFQNIMLNNLPQIYKIT